MRKPVYLLVLCICLCIAESESIMPRIKQPINEGGAALEIKIAPREDMSSILYLLIENGSRVTCWPDINGLTPLHRAVSLRTPYNLQVIRTIIYHWPQSAEVGDAYGNSILHLLIGRMPSYQEGKNLLRLKAIYALRDYQDQQGNTPLHIAATKMDTNMVRVLLESSTKLNIKNVIGISAASLIQQLSIFEKLRRRKMTGDECEAADKADISFLRKRMSKLGTDFSLSHDSEGRNILHSLMQIKNESRIIRDDFVDFIQQVLGSFPELLSQRDYNGDTPIHVLVRNHPDTLILDVTGNQDNRQQNSDDVFSTLRQSGLLPVLLELCNQCTLQIQNEVRSIGTRYDQLWVMQNAEGNTPLHEALLANNNILARALLQHDKGQAGLLNKFKETPLHLLAGRSPCLDMKSFKLDDIKLLVDANVEAAFLLDRYSLTPILRAWQAGNHSMASLLCTFVPEASKIPNTDGQTFWHLLLNHPSRDYVFRLIQNESLREALRSQDEYGNTPLHLAIEGHRYDLVQVFFDIWKNEPKSSSKGKDDWLVDLLNIHNKAGITPAHLIGESPSLPFQIEETILSNPRMMGIRSAWGIPKSQLQTYMNSMNVIAALLTTITFTTAFSVPGGLMQDKGTPVLIQQAIFQVFIIADVLAMCLSMMVLFCLLWIMATSNQRDSVMIQDFIVSLMLASFVATLVTFMTGLYATIFPVKPWIAIIALVLCSSLMLLVHKVIVIKLLIPFRKATVNFFWKFRQLFVYEKFNEPVPATFSIRNSERAKPPSPSTYISMWE